MSESGDYTQYEYRNSEAGYAASYISTPAFELLGRLSPESSVLEAGCGNGAFAMEMASRGYHVTAFDQSVSGIEIAQKRAGAVRYLNASVYDDLRKLIPSEDFDAVVALEVIEHLYSPARFLENVRSVLRKDGMLILSTPYHGYLKNVALAVSGQLDRHFTALWEGGHIKFWSRTTLEALLVQSGFRPIAFRGAGRLPFFWKSMLVAGLRD
jgi:2-polyprenyl-3-methyl-5-hydroxy-6-metoxy-1,4-benzoquinol methylase